MQSLLELHRSIAWFLVVSNAAVGAWSLVAHKYPAWRSPVLWWCIGIAQVSAFVMAIIGTLMVNRNGVELDQFHALYGFSAIVAIGILYSYRTSPFINDKQYLLYGLGSLFIMGLGLRAMYL